MFNPKSEPALSTDEYDRKHGDPAKGKDHECVNLSEAANKEPPQDQSFKVTNSGK